MADFDFYSRIRLSSPKVKRSFSDLHNVYNSIPDTKGCMENISKEGGCGAWCCKYQTPQLLYSEFLLLWNHVSRNWSDEDFVNLIERCMRNVVNEMPTKGCVFFDDKTKMCKIHKVRPYNCRIYGITPAEEFNPRYERLQKEFKGVIGAVIRPQCDLVSTTDGTTVTVEQTNKWWQKLNDIEHKIGIRRELINDDMGGSYRSPHDHIMLYTMPENVLTGLAAIRLYDDWMQKMQAVSDLSNTIRHHFGVGHGKRTD